MGPTVRGRRTAGQAAPRTSSAAPPGAAHPWVRHLGAARKAVVRGLGGPADWLEEHPEQATALVARISADTARE
ncbi:hypothetical protein ACGFZK_13505 [Streptomyces sp. NPDC048257]|uniref:hypothetical protein n=1 Tax=Streptomyces sp. NPDC048257 TaxID=3365526 RepID=UPI00371368F5